MIDKCFVSAADAYMVIETQSFMLICLGMMLFGFATGLLCNFKCDKDAK